METKQLTSFLKDLTGSGKELSWLYILEKERWKDEAKEAKQAKKEMKKKLTKAEKELDQWKQIASDLDQKFESVFEFESRYEKLLNLYTDKEQEYFKMSDELDMQLRDNYQK